MTRAPEPIRSDAKANRRRILEVAREAFAAPGETSLNAIAKRAGVGPGTMYRHFPTREDLILSVYQAEIDDIVALAPALLAEQKPLDALESWFDRLARYGQVKYGVAEVIHAVSSEHYESDAYRRVVGAIQLLLDACAAEGVVKAEVRADDVLLLAGVLWRIDPATGGVERGRRILKIVIDGLRNTGNL